MKRFILALALVFAGCTKAPAPTKSPPAHLTIGVAFETLQTEYWVAGFAAIKAEIAARGGEAREAVADGDSNRQLEQVKNFITQRVDGIILVPTDAQTCLPIIKAANSAGIPIVLFNRPAETSEARSFAVVADNFGLTQQTVAYLIGEARKTGHKQPAMILIGDLGDINGVRRREGFDAAVKNQPDAVEVVARVPTDWSQEKAQAGVINALQAHPDIGFIFTSSDFLLPSIVSALKSVGKYQKVGETGHVILGGFDGDATAYRMLQEGYLDATGVQDVYFEAKECVAAIAALKDGKTVPSLILDPGFVITQANLTQRASQMWGSHAAKK